MSHSPKSHRNPSERKRIFLSNYQFRFALLVAGSCVILIVFSVLYNVTSARSILPQEVFALYYPQFISSLWKFILAAGIFIGVMTLASLFMSHRTVGPLARLEADLQRHIASSDLNEPLKVREDDDVEGIVRAINLLIDRYKRK